MNNVTKGYVKTGTYKHWQHLLNRIFIFCSFIICWVIWEMFLFHGPHTIWKSNSCTVVKSLLNLCVWKPYFNSFILFKLVLLSLPPSKSPFPLSSFLPIAFIIIIAYCVPGSVTDKGSVKVSETWSLTTRSSPSNKEERYINGQWQLFF